jgi:c-di-GMP-binding flagellar brake protein YcgR
MINKITISDPNDIKVHVQIIAGLHTPVTAQTETGDGLSEGRLLFQPSDQETIIVQLAPRQCPHQGAIKISYTLQGVPYQFSSKIKGPAGVQSNLALLPIELPASIQSMNRRVYIRTKFPLNDPLGFDLNISRHCTMRLFAEDISAGGIGFFVPESMNRFAMGSKHPIKFQLPGSDEILAQIDVRNLRQLFGMRRIGCKYVSLDVKLRMKILELVSINESRKTRAAGEPGRIENIRLFVDDHPGHQPLWPFLESRYDVQRNILKNHALYLQADGPELIILNLDADNSVETLKLVRSSAHLKSLPLILVSERYSSPPFDMPEVRFARPSVEYEGLTDLIDQLVYAYRWSRKISQLHKPVCQAQRIIVDT